MSEYYNNSDNSNDEYDLDEHMNNYDATAENQSAPPAWPLTEEEAMA